MTPGLNLETLFLLLVALHAVEKLWGRPTVWAVVWGLFFSLALAVLL